MSQEDMAKELDRILEKLRELDPTTEAYSFGIKNYHELMKTLHEELDACDSDLDRRQKRYVEQKRAELAEREERNRRIQFIVDSILRVSGKAVSAGMLLGGIILTGTLEQNTILSSKCFSLVQKFIQKV